ncbi:uncharacterized protein LOC143230366 isoform X3 [Tachypleus tridentatus]|uniref:uncharacterized protein LOC143230366 isoform X3 n=1 Tax=Tachypleus tridentatus TaxID=6853 RepID=UPI003FD44D12
MENWQDWVDVQWSDIPKPRAKLRVSLVFNDGVTDGEIAVVNPPNPEVPSSKQSASLPIPSTEQISCILAFKPWPVSFKLENLSSLPRSSALLLSQGKPVEKEGLFHLLDAVYTEVSIYSLSCGG